ncbi:AAA family ATPase [Variovorax paradoxus]|uniref:AAA family ATPase n=1 Tax=Variovorax paradoxus TaxID=34073 RepID=A0A5Q0M4R7_VARPD|nr:AAA family ATPase [Variovorax paradoxus]QFZ84533.1 AAA family ATPase [Variovorax paradoxus]
MKFLSAHIENFLTVAAGTVKLADRGLNLIQGVNADDDSASSNGAGKSSIVDAICWCLYGVTARGVKGDSVVNLKAKKNTAVIVMLENGATTYKVERYRKHATGKNSLRLYAITDPTAPGVDMTRGTDAETQKEVEKILGCSLEVFIAAVYSGQEAMPDLPKMGDRDLKRLIEEGAGMQRIERAYALSRTRLTSAKYVLDGYVARLETAKTGLLRTESALEIRREKAKQWNDGRAGVIAGLEARVNAAKADATTKALHAQSLKPKADAATTRLAEIGVSLAAHATAQRAAADAQKALSRAELAVEKHQLQQATEAVVQAQADVDNAEQDLSKPCRSCGQPGSLHKLDDYRDHKRALLVAAKGTLEDLKVRVRSQVLAVQAAKTTHEEALAAVPDVTALNAERAGLEADKTALQNAIRVAQTAKQTYDQEKLSLDNAKAAVNPEQSVVEELEERLTYDNTQISGWTAEIAKATAEVAVAEGVVKVFGPAGVRAQILDTVTPFLNARTADYLSVLSDGAMQAIWTTLTKSATGDLKEKFSIEVTHSKGADSFAGLSGGEKRKVRLATALALQDLVASRATQPIDIWFGDEVDDALDPSGLERLMTILERKARERGTVIVISHNSLGDWIDNVTTVTKADGVSTVEGALCD